MPELWEGEAMTPKPKRIQRKRTKGWRMPPNAVYVGRPSKWGNPFQIGLNRSAVVSLTRFHHALKSGSLRLTAEDVRRELRGKDLVCWCPLDQACHAGVLLEIANEEE